MGQGHHFHFHEITCLHPNNLLDYLHTASSNIDNFQKTLTSLTSTRFQTFLYQNSTRKTCLSYLKIFIYFLQIPYANPSPIFSTKNSIDNLTELILQLLFLKQKVVQILFEDGHWYWSHCWPSRPFGFVQAENNNSYNISFLTLEEKGRRKMRSGEKYTFHISYHNCTISFSSMVFFFFNLKIQNNGIHFIQFRRSCCFIYLYDI